MLITYKKTRTGYEPQVDDECEVYVDGKYLWVKIVRINDDGYIRTEDDNGMRVDFPTKVDLFEAIADV